MRKWINLFENYSHSLSQEVDAWKPPRGLTQPRPEDWEMFRKVRSFCRAANGGGGYCHEVSEWIEDKYRWKRQAGTYLSKDGEVAIAGHYWNILPDGSILDCTADQTGEGHDMRIIPPSDPEHGRYDEEWYEDWHPGHEDYDSDTRTVKTGMRKPEHYTGMGDFDMQDKLSSERGSYWFSTHPDQFEEYINQQIEYARNDPHKNEWSDHSIEGWQRWLADVKKRYGQ